MRGHELRPAAEPPRRAQPGPSTEGRAGHGAIAELDNMAPASRGRSSEPVTSPGRGGEGS